MKEDKEVSLVGQADDRLVYHLNKVVVLCVKGLAILITIVIIWGVLDVAYHVFNQATLFTPGTFNIENLVVTMGNFLAVLIAIEIFMNIIFYLKRDTVHVHLVIATALTAVARKIIVFDFSAMGPSYLYATAAAVIALGVAFWLVSKAQSENIISKH